MGMNTSQIKKNHQSLYAVSIEGFSRMFSANAKLQ